MVEAENYVPTNECAPNNEVLCISSYYSVQMRQRERERQGHIVAHGDTRSRVQLGKRRTWPPRVQVYSLVSGFLFVSIWGMRTSRIILCYFGDKI